MVTAIIPTKNRQETLLKVLPSYLLQNSINQIIVVDDGSIPAITVPQSEKVEIIRNESSLGPAVAKSQGAEMAKGPFVLIGEDDVILEQDYVEVLLAKALANPRLGVVSGRIIYLRPNESTNQALARRAGCDHGLDIFQYDTLTLDTEVDVLEDQCVPFTHAIFLTGKREFLESNEGSLFNIGNNYREESIGQLKMYFAGRTNILTPETTCFHLAKADVPGGGNRISRLRNLLSTVRNNNRFIEHIHEPYQRQTGLGKSMFQMKMTFAAHYFHRLYVDPLIRLSKTCVSFLFFR